MCFPNLPLIGTETLHPPICDDEIRAAIFQMGPNKALKPNELPSFFFQANRDVVESSVCQFIKEAFLQDSFPREINETLITLIPKQDHLEQVSQF